LPVRETYAPNPHMARSHTRKLDLVVSIAQFTLNVDNSVCDATLLVAGLYNGGQVSR